MQDCLFCNITAGKMNNLIWENDIAVAFKDIHPKAPTHILIVPKAHVANLDELDDAELAGRLLMATREVAKQAGVAGNYRLTTNNGEGAGQIIHHLHFHLLSGMKPTEDPDV